MSFFPVDSKTKSVVHYIISHTEPDKLGAVKLNKVMWRADVQHYRQHGTTITGQMSYVRMPQGPVPNFVSEALTELKAEGKIFERAKDTYAGTRREFVWLHKADVKEFSSSQIEILLEAISTICRKSAASASEETHDTLWSEISNGLQMPIRAASVTPVILEPSDIDWALQSA